MIDAHVLTEPRVFQISKINRSNSKGVVIFTCAQDLANQHTLKADYDSDGNVIAWWADWYEGNVEPTPAITDDDLSDKSSSPTPSQTIKSSITCSGKPQIKIGGSAKTFTVTYYDENGEQLTDHPVGTWSVTMDGQYVSNTLIQYTDVVGSPEKLKIKFLGDDSYIGKILTVTNSHEDATASLDIEMLPL